MVIDRKRNIKCIKCGTMAHKIMVVQGRGYGSKLDCIAGATLLPICPKCSDQLNDEWFCEPCIIEDGYCETYPNEHKIMDFICSLQEDIQVEVLQ